MVAVPVAGREDLLELVPADADEFPLAVEEPAGPIAAVEMERVGFDVQEVVEPVSVPIAGGYDTGR